MDSETREEEKPNEESLTEEIKGIGDAEMAENEGVEVENGDGETEIGELKKNKEGEPEEKKKRRKRKSLSSREPVTPMERPARERKIVERYSVPSLEKVSASKTLAIPQGRGVQLKDIPNVAFKLSKRKPDENLQMLHAILFGKRSKAHSLKRNINQFSGFVWVENEEKQRAKIKEKLDKCHKVKLLVLCDMLDIQVVKATTKKDAVATKLLEFLESPHVTREVSLADKDQKGKKRKRKALASANTVPKEASSGLAKKKKKSPEAKKKHGNSSRNDEGNENESLSTDMEIDSDEKDVTGRIQTEESDHEDQDIEEEEDQAKEQAENKNISGSEIKESFEAISVFEKESSTEPEQVPTKSRKSRSTIVSKKVAVADDKSMCSPSNIKGASSKKQKEDKRKMKKGQTASLESKRTSSGKPQKTKEAKVSRKKKQDKDSAVPAKPEPSRAEMHAAVNQILKEVDFNTATLSDIIKQLGTKFSMDLMHRKSEVKSIIQEVINSMTDEDEEEEENDANHET